MQHRAKVSWMAEKPTERLVPTRRQTLPSISHHSGEPLSIELYNHRPGQFTSPVDPGPLAALVLLRKALDGEVRPPQRRPLYRPDERRRRDASVWTIVQGVLAPIQFAVFLLSLCLVIRYLVTGEGLAIATASIVFKTLLLYAIMITGSIWEREVFGQYLFARPFFWEDVFSMLVLALHTLYIASLVTAALEVRDQMLVALAAYAAYIVNATQFLLKLRTTRLDGAGAEARVAEPAR
jgi:3-vinyl bacteriochlorophyllide hydratase